MASSAYKISLKSTDRFKSYIHTDLHTGRKAGDLISLLSLLEINLKLYQERFAIEILINRLCINVITFTFRM
jgi:hypothetical protein